MVIIILALLGLVFGSFINALIYRLHIGKDWVAGRSECPHCHHLLGPKDLVPVLSWVSLGGKCRYCRKPIPDSPLVELSTALVFVLSYVYGPNLITMADWFQFVIWLLLAIILIALAVYDLRWLLLPNKLVFPAIGLSVVYVLIGGGLVPILTAALSATILSGLFLAIYAVSKGKWIGFGDVKLALALGLLAGTPLMSMLLLFVASFSGLLAAVPMLIKGKAKKDTKLPFGTLLIFGLFVVYLFGQDIIDQYLGLLTY
jgi:prepilin signal peptidase PulO-like enzyme (type II secretory pathway)